MDDAAIESTLAAGEHELDAGRTPDLRGAGFWRAVAAVKAERARVERCAERIARIDREVFRRRVPLAFPAAVGLVLLSGAVATGVALLVAAPAAPAPWRELLVLAGFGALDGATHGLAHYVVGGALGIRFSHWFVAVPSPPGFKTDYASYLRASPRARAWMHASGALVTKFVPFAVAAYGAAIGAEAWAIAVALAVGVVQIVTDALFSVKGSDWKKFRREMRLARR